MTDFFSNTIVSAILLCAFGLNVGAPQAPTKRPAILVEVQALEKCVGLDCPPWHVPEDIGFCFESDGNFYTGIYRPAPFPWATKGERLRALKDKSVTIELKAKTIWVSAPKLRLSLKRVHHASLFRLANCADN